MFIARGRCEKCLRIKKVLKMKSQEEPRGLCRKCLKDLSDHPKFK